MTTRDGFLVSHAAAIGENSVHWDNFSNCAAKVDLSNVFVERAFHLIEGSICTVNNPADMNSSLNL